MLSDINLVQKQADKYGIGRVYISNRKDKKYMIINLNGDKVHFGQKGYADFTGHKDENRRRLFRQRNNKWKDAKKGTPSWLSYYLLW